MLGEGEARSGVEAGAGLLTGGPERFSGLAVAQAVGAELQEGFGSGLAPELFGAFDSVVQLLHRRFHNAAGEGQAEFS